MEEHELCVDVTGHKGQTYFTHVVNLLEIRDKSRDFNTLAHAIEVALLEIDGLLRDAFDQVAKEQGWNEL